MEENEEGRDLKSRIETHYYAGMVSRSLSQLHELTAGSIQIEEYHHKILAHCTAVIAGYCLALGDMDIAYRNLITNASRMNKGFAHAMARLMPNTDPNITEAELVELIASYIDGQSEEDFQ